MGIKLLILLSIYKEDMHFGLSFCGLISHIYNFAW